MMLRRALSSSSSAALEERLLAALRSARDPVLDVDVVSGGLADCVVSEKEDGRHVGRVSLDVGSAGHPYRDDVASACATAASDVRGLSEVEVTLRASGFGASPKAQSPGLRSVRSALAVSSCKGGVGKSTVAWQLARTLWRRGGRVGVLDADVHGPSLPRLSGKVGSRHEPSPAGGGFMMPVRGEDSGVLRLASIGFIDESKSGGPSSLRGPLSSRVATQLLNTTDWGELDYLIVDLPPGIGDIPLSICRDLGLDGVVLVSTPSKLSQSDVERGLGLLKQFRIPTIALVENMSYLDCDGCGKRHHVFGDHSATDELAENVGLESRDEMRFELPFSLAVRDSNEGDVETSAVDDAFAPLAKHCAAHLLREQYATRNQSVTATFDRTSSSITIRIFEGEIAIQHNVPIAAILKVSENLHPVPKKPESPPPTPTRVFLIGKRAVSLDWSDGLKNDVHLLETLIGLT